MKHNHIFLVYLYEAGRPNITIGAYTDKNAARERVRKAKRERPHRIYGYEVWTQEPGKSDYSFTHDWRYDEEDGSFYDVSRQALEEGQHANV